MMERLIFLDIDGVLISGNWMHETKQALIPDPECVARFNRVTQVTGAKIVLSSSWRIGREVIRCRELLASWGITAPCIGRTPTVAGYRVTRGEEIQVFLDGYTPHRDVSSFVILDDDADMGDLSPHLIKCEFLTGLTDELAAECIRRLV